MKKVLALFAIVALASCGNGTSTKLTSDSTAVAVDSTLVDSTVVSVDSVKAEVPSVELK
jgi:uncharacterized lipoprotein YajG